MLSCSSAEPGTVQQKCMQASSYACLTAPPWRQLPSARCPAVMLLPWQRRPLLRCGTGGYGGARRTRRGSRISGPRAARRRRALVRLQPRLALRARGCAGALARTAPPALIRSMDRGWRGRDVLGAAGDRRFSTICPPGGGGARRGACCALRRGTSTIRWMRH